MSTERETSLPPPQSLDQVRTKIQQLTTSLQSLHLRILHSAVLPPWSQLQSGLGVILTQLASLTDTLARNEDELRSVVSVPNAAFPVTTHEGLLTTLMRTKPLPESEEWLQAVERESTGLVTYAPFKWAMNEPTEVDEDMDGDEYDVMEWLNIQKQKRQWTGFYTKQEVDDAFEIDRDDLDDIRRARQVESTKSMADVEAMLRFARSGR